MKTNTTNRQPAYSNPTEAFVKRMDVNKPKAKMRRHKPATKPNPLRGY